MQSNPLIRIFRVLGGLSIVILLGIKRFDYFLHAYVLYFLLFLGLLFVVYNIILTFYRVKNIYKILKSDKLDIKNSPLDRIATLAARAIFCAKGACEAASPVAAGLGLMIGIDTVIKEGGRDPIFTPFLAKLFVHTESEAAKSARFVNKSIAALKQNVEDTKVLTDIEGSIKSAGISGGLTETEGPKGRGDACSG